MAINSSNTASLDSLKPTVAEAAAEFGIPEDSIWRKVRAENSGSVAGAANLQNVRTDAVSPKSAKGIMQVTQVALDDVIEQGLVPAGTKLDGLSPKDQIRIGAAYIKRLRDSYSTDPAVEDAMYNFGPKARFQMDNLPEETRGYLQKTGARMADSNSNTGQQETTFGAGMMGSKDLLSALLGSNQQQNQNIASGAQEVSKVQEQANIQRATSIGAQKGATDAAMVVAGQKADIAYQQAALGQQLQKMFNLDPTDTNNEISTSLAAAELAKQARVGARAEFDQANSIGLLDDPLQYLVNQIRLPQLAAKNNALADQEDLALNNVSTKTAMLKAAQNTLVANTADQVKQTMLDEAKVTHDMATAKLSEEEAKNLASTATQKLQLIGLVDKMGDNTRATIGTVISLQDREEQASIRNLAKKDISDKKKLEQEDEDRLNARLKLVSSSLGMVEPMTVRRLRTLQNKKDQDVWLNAATTGQMGEDLQSSLGFYLGNGSRVGITNSGGASTYLTAKKLEQAGANEQAAIEREAQATGKKLSNKDLVSASYKLYEDTVVNSMRSPGNRSDLSSSTWDKTYNPYIAPFKGFNGAITARPELAGLKNNAMTKAVDGLLTSDSVKGENLTADQQQQAIGSIAKQVELRTITPAKAAADISVYISAASAWNRQMNGYSLFTIPAQDAYLFTMDGEVTRRKVDLMNPSVVENALIKRVTESRAVNAGFGYSPFGVN
jgi:hypothetical protein